MYILFLFISDVTSVETADLDRIKQELLHPPITPLSLFLHAVIICLDVQFVKIPFCKRVLFSLSSFKDRPYRTVRL